VLVEEYCVKIVKKDVHMMGFFMYEGGSVWCEWVRTGVRSGAWGKRAVV